MILIITGAVESDSCFKQRDFHSALLTNFNKKDLGIYLKSLMLYQDPTLFISENAYDCNKRRIEGHYALKTTIRKDRTEFWDLFDKIRKRLI